MRHLSCFAGIGIMMTLSAPSLALASTSYTITDLGRFTSAGYSNGRCLNENGQVGGYSSGEDHYSRAFLWENGVMTDLGTHAATASFAQDINNAGQVVIRTYSPATGWLWENGSVTRIPALAGGSENEANGINDQGQVFLQDRNSSFSHQ